MADNDPSAIDIQHHLMSFVDAFVIGAKKDRWKELLARRRKNTFRDSHKLEAALDKRFRTRTLQTNQPAAATLGVYFDFYSDPVVITEAEVNEQNSDLKGYRDAIFSVVPGRLAYYFFHEGWCWKCER